MNHTVDRQTPTGTNSMSNSGYPLPVRETGFEPRERRHSRRVIATLTITCLASAALLVQAPLAGAAITFTPPTPNIGILPFPGDVYVLNSMGALVSVDPTSTPASAQLFNLAGNALNLTWGQFSSATAKSYVWTDTVNGVTHTDFLIGMRGLVPNGVYSIFYRTFTPASNNAFCPNVEPSLALTSAFPKLQRPDSSSFVASGSGKGLFVGRVDGNLQAAAQLQESVIYHFNGNTYGPLANAAEAESVNEGVSPCRSSYGVDAMRQFLIIQK
jgi:hypothetical protein